MMSPLRIVNIALTITICFFIATPYFNKEPSVKISLTNMSFAHKLNGNILSITADDDGDVFEYIYNIYPRIESFVMSKEKNKVKAEIVLQ